MALKERIDTGATCGDGSGALAMAAGAAAGSGSAGAGAPAASCGLPPAPPKPKTGFYYEHIEPILDGYFAVDLRSLAVTRILTALIILADIVFRWEDALDFLSDDGILPRQVLLEKFMNRYYFSLHLMTGIESGIQVLLAVHFLLAFLLLIGYRTRLMTLLNWVFVSSIVARNPIIVQADDALLIVTLFWGFWVPWGARFSFDGALRTNPEVALPKFVTSIGTVALLFQPFFLYFFTGLLKSGKEWHSEFTAVFYALAHESFTQPAGFFLLEMSPPWLLKAMTAYTLYLEILGPVLMLWPFAFIFFKPLPNLLPGIRTVCVFLFFNLQMGLGATMNPGIFPWIATAAILPYIPVSFWDYWARNAVTAEVRGLTIFYDAGCGFCRKMVLIIRAFFLPQGTVIRTCQEVAAVEQQMLKENSVVDASGKSHYRFEALAYVIGLSPWAFWLAPVMRFGPFMAIGTWFYKHVANNRQLMGGVTAPFIGRPMHVHLGFVSTFLCAASFYAVVLSNLDSIGAYKTDPNYHWVGRVFRLAQSWKMFAPRPPTVDGYFAIPAKLRDGSMVDLFSGGGGKLTAEAGKSLTWEKPKRKVSRTFANYRWRKFYSNIGRSKNKAYRLHYGRYFCRNWNRTHHGGKTLEEFEIVSMQERQDPENWEPDDPEPKKVVLWRHYCFPKDKNEGSDGAAEKGAGEKGAGEKKGP